MEALRRNGAGFFSFWKLEKTLKKILRRYTPVAEKSGKSNGESAGQGEDQEIALAGNYDGKEAAVGGDGEIAETEAVKNENGLRLRDGSVMP